MKYFAFKVMYVINFYRAVNPGMNTIHQPSRNSSVTIPYERSFRNISRDQMPGETKALSEFQFCGCGWPEHMLLPKGKPEGMNFHLFVMISDHEGDMVQQADGSVSTLFLNFLKVALKII